jgi:general secretion pathway protein L
MKLRIFVPAGERSDAAARWPWMLLDARNALAREGATPPAQMPRADRVELVLPASRVLFARLALPRVGSGTLRELLPFAVEDRLLADPSRIHAVAGQVDRRGETLVAVIDREWLVGNVQALRAAGLSPTSAWCESALLARGAGDWNLVLGPDRGLLVDSDGAAVTFDRAPGTSFPLALRIALDEASARGERPPALRVHTEADAPLPDLERWSADAGVKLVPGSRWEMLSRGAPGPGTIELLTADLAPRARALAALRVPRAAVLLAASIALVQVALDAAQAWQLDRERSRLRANAETIFRSAFPEAKAVVDPVLQMRRNLAELRRSRGLAGGDEFLVRLTRAAQEAPGPVRSIEYAGGRLDVKRGAGPSLAQVRR